MSRALGIEKQDSPISYAERVLFRTQNINSVLRFGEQIRIPVLLPLAYRDRHFACFVPNSSERLDHNALRCNTSFTLNLSLIEMRT